MRIVSRSTRTILLKRVWITTALLLLLIDRLPTCYSFVVPLRRTIRTRPTFTRLWDANDNNNNKFGWAQRLESIKTLVISSISGSIMTFPLILFNDSFVWAQFEFDTDGAALCAGLFGIVYRYTIRQDDNPQLNRGVIASFVWVRTISKCHVPSHCTALPLQCGPPLGYLDWDLLRQLVAYGVEASVLFGGTALVLDACMERSNILSKFPN